MNEAAPASPERIAKRIARAGACSRRDAERWIEAGRVAVDGQILTSPAVTVTPDQEVTIDGQALAAAEPARLFRFHKPAGILTAARDPAQRKTIYDLLPEGLPRLMPVGRLDLNSEGLLLLTNDGGLKRRLELPSTGWLRRYRVRLHGQIDEAKLAKLMNGITVDGFDYGPIEAVLDRVQGSNAWLTVAMREGKNREIRRVMEHFGWRVNRLIRLCYGPFQLGGLMPNALEEVAPKVLGDQLGSLLTDERARPRRRSPGATARASQAPAAARAAEAQKQAAAERLPARQTAQPPARGAAGGKRASSAPKRGATKLTLVPRGEPNPPSDTRKAAKPQAGVERAHGAVRRPTRQRAQRQARAPR